MSPQESFNYNDRVFNAMGTWQPAARSPQIGQLKEHAESIRKQTAELEKVNCIGGGSWNINFGQLDCLAANRNLLGYIIALSNTFEFRVARVSF
jgi:hypothetical protein